jgi:hypothetical protein
MKHGIPAISKKEKTKNFRDEYSIIKERKEKKNLF